MDDAELIAAARRGEREAFGVLVERYQRMVEAAVMSATGRRMLIDDVVQDTFVTAWCTLERLRDPARVRPWLYGIARNLACKAHRRHRHEAQLDDVASSESPFDVVSERERDRELASAVARLPARYREPLVLFYYEHCTVKEVASALGMPEGAVMQRLSRGRRKLGEALATNVEIALETKLSRPALAACVVTLLSTRVVSAASAATTSAAANATATVVWWRAVATWLGVHWRIPGAVLASAVAVVVLVAATAKSEAVAARANARSEHPSTPEHANARSEPPSTSKPSTPEHAPPALDQLDDAQSTRIYANVSPASFDPVETCARGARGLVTWLLGKDAFRTLDGEQYFEPSPELQRTLDRVAERAGADCGGGQWPELYVMCEGTMADVVDGNVTCYPHDPFAER